MPQAQHLFVDVTELAGNDLKTGIQRVVRSIYQELPSASLNGFKLVPVMLTFQDAIPAFRVAEGFENYLCSPKNHQVRVQPGMAIEVNRGDIFLGLDLCPNVRHSISLIEEMRRNGASVFFVVYDLLPLSLPSYFPDGVEAAHREWIYAVSRGNGVLCISRSVADDVRRWLEESEVIMSHRFRIGWFHLGADIEHSVPSKGIPDDFLEQLYNNIQSNTSLLMVGTIEPRKGHGQVLQAFELLWRFGWHANLVIVGKQGWMVDELADRLRSHPEAGHRLFWYEGLSDEALEKLYAASNGLIMASEGEGFGLPLIEAAKHELPVFARDLPVFLEVAGSNAGYFTRSSPVALAFSLAKWIRKLESGSAPSSKGINWLTWKESARQIAGLVTDAAYPNWLHDISPTLKKGMGAKRSPSCIAVDMTLIQPGGINGGAKVFLLELLGMLAEMQPETRFLLLTCQGSHEELAMLDRANVYRIMVHGDPATVTDSRNRYEMAMQAAMKREAWAIRTAKGWKRSIDKRIGRRKASSPAPPSLLRGLGADLLYSPFAALDLAEPGIPAVCTFYDLQHMTYPGFFTPEEVTNRDRLFYGACRKATAIAAISEYSRQSAIEHGAIDPDMVRTIPIRLAHRVSPDEKCDDEIFKLLNIKQDEYLVFPANFWEHKNHELLLRAFRSAGETGLSPEVKLVCTGAPCERRDRMIALASSMGLAERVIFPGYVTNRELAMIVSHARAMVFPSLYEGFGMPVIEAMAEGVPVACSNTRALPEVAGDAAILFDPTDESAIAQAIITICSDEELRASLVNKGLARAHEFSDRERMAREYWELFEEASATGASDKHPLR